jgi:hypothetical protein
MPTSHLLLTVANFSNSFQIPPTSNLLLSKYLPCLPLKNFTLPHNIQQSSSRDTLTTVSLHHNVAVDEDAPPSHSLEAHTLLPLLQCPNVENLSISHSLWVRAIDNSLMEAMAWHGHIYADISFAHMVAGTPASISAVSSTLPNIAVRWSQ